MNNLRQLSGLIILALGMYAAWIVLAGLSTGEIMQLSKHGNTILHKATETSRYWIAIVFWSIATVILIGGGLLRMRKR